jgi:pimeloyl-ACP methyl ester carboxylesterase
MRPGSSRRRAPPGAVAVPGTELERMLVLSAMGGTTGWHYSITRNSHYASHAANYAGAAAALIDDVLAFPHLQSAEDLKRFLDPLPGHDTTDLLPRITAPTLVLSGGADPGARFEVLEGEAHQPFQEVPDRWNARVDAFWQEVEAEFTGLPSPREVSDRERLEQVDRSPP